MESLKALQSKITFEMENSIDKALADEIPQAISPTEGVELQLQNEVHQEADQMQQIDLNLEAMLQQELQQESSDFGIINVFSVLKIESFNQYFNHDPESPFLSQEKIYKNLIPSEKELVSVGLGRMDLIFHEQLVRDSNRSKPSILTPSIANEGAGLAYFVSNEGMEGMFLISAAGLVEIFEDLKNNYAQVGDAEFDFKLCLTDMAGRYLGPKTKAPSFLIKQNLFQIPGWKERHLGSYFKAHLFNGGMNYISTLPELREEFGAWLRLRDLEIKAHPNETIFKRLKFLALKLKGSQKDEFIFKKEKDQFIKILYTAIAKDDVQMYFLLLSLFPEDQSKQTTALQAINFSASKMENIWKQFKPELFKLRLYGNDLNAALSAVELVKLKADDFPLSSPLLPCGKFKNQKELDQADLVTSTKQESLLVTKNKHDSSLNNLKVTLPLDDTSDLQDSDNESLDANQDPAPS